MLFGVCEIGVSGGWTSIALIVIVVLKIARRCQYEFATSCDILGVPRSPQVRVV